MTSAPPVLHWNEVFGPFDRVFVERHRLVRDRDVHDHDFMELVVVLAGESLHESAQGRCDLRAGDAMLLRPGTWHAYRACEGLEVVNFCFPFAFARAEGKDLLDERVRRLLRSGSGLTVTRLPDAAVRVIEGMERLERGTTGALGLLIWCLDQFAEAARIPDKAIHPAVERALAAMENRPDLLWTATELAKEAALDKAYLSRLFARQIGVSPMAYLGILRLERAGFLLGRSEMTCAEIGAAVGYASPEQFSKRFRARYGVSPSSYRKRVQATKPGPLA